MALFFYYSKKKSHVLRRLDIKCLRALAKAKAQNLKTSSLARSSKFLLRLSKKFDLLKKRAINKIDIDNKSLALNFFLLI